MQLNYRPQDEEFYTIKTPFIDNYNDIIYWFKKIM